MTSGAETEERKLPAGTREVLRYAEEHPEEFETIVQLVGDSAAERSRSRRTVEYGASLRDRLDQLMNPSDFEAGDLVCWKPGMKNRKRPDYDEPGIVVDVLSEAIPARPEESGSSYFREPLTITIGLLDPDDEFVVFHFDARRFTKFDPDGMSSSKSSDAVKT